jgi:TPR repeat protein
MYKLAQCFEDGWGCVRDLAKAADLYTEAAEGACARLQLLRLAPTNDADGVHTESSINPSCDFQLADEN